MKRYPVTGMEFQDMFPTEEASYLSLQLMRWPNGYCCPHCEQTEAWTLKRNIYRCKRCSREVSPPAGTIFEGTRTPLRLWFQAVWYIVKQKNGVSALGLQKVLGLKSDETAWTWLHKLRTAMIRPGRDRLSGTVEVDETFIGGPKPGKRGRGAAGKVLVLVGVEDKGAKGIGRIRLQISPDASGSTLKGAIKDMIAPLEVRCVPMDGVAIVVPVMKTMSILLDRTLKKNPAQILHRSYIELPLFSSVGCLGLTMVE